MPGGNDYQGPPEALVRYRAVIAAVRGEAAIKGAKNPYTARNGNMFSFLAPDGSMALRLSPELGERFVAEYDSGPVMQHGSVMRGYVSIPPELFTEPTELALWFDRAWDWTGSLPAKPTKKK